MRACITSRTSTSTFRWANWWAWPASPVRAKSSLALGVLYAEGSRRYLEALSTYTRRRLTQASRAQVDEVLHVPAALALHQRPTVPGIRSTFGTMTELLNSLRLLFSRVASHVCPHLRGARNEPTLNVRPACPSPVLAAARNSVRRRRIARLQLGRRLRRPAPAPASCAK